MPRRSKASVDVPRLPGPVDQYVSARVPTCLPNATAEQVLDGLPGNVYDEVSEVAVCDEPEAPRRLLGLVPLSVLLSAPPTTAVSELMDVDPPVVLLGHDSEQAASKAVRHGESSLAVLDAEGYLVGLVPPSRLLGLVLRAHDEDFARLGGYLASSKSARLAIEEPMVLRLWHRLPWLALGLAGAAASAVLVEGFEDRLAEDVRLAFFIPGVVYLADAVGTQTEALVVRGLSVGSSARAALMLEFVTGPVLGLILALLVYPALLWSLDDAALALAVSLSLWAACSVATLVAATLPVAIARTGRDPAFGSGPLATVIQDLLSLAIYFAVVVVVIP